jgi:transglutaminase-like putative cysteine protease
MDFSLHARRKPDRAQHSRPVRAALRGVVLLAACASVAGAAPVEPGWGVAPPASWVRQLPLPSADTPLRAGADSGRLYLLVDHQVHLGRVPVEYHRFAWTPLSTAGVQNASEIQVHFDPAYQRLVVHHVRLLRGGKDTFAFHRSDVRVIQQERSLDEQIYSGELTAVVFLRDLRPGDVLDYAYSLEGTNPIVGGDYDDELALAYESPVRLIRHVVQVPEKTVLHLKPQNTTIEPRIETEGGWRTYTWEARDAAASAADDGEPGWFDPDPRVEVSTFASWAEVADWARGLFEGQLKPSADVQRLAERFRAAPGGLAGAAAEATRFVQDEVRYLGIEMGPSSHQPHSPDQVLRQRFGDCKDKALLLVALLRELGIHATPALVDTERRHGLDLVQPSPFAFDHAIVRASVGGRDIWIDATESDMGGRLEDRDPPEFERALVLEPGTRALTPIPLPEFKEPALDVRETFTLGPSGSPARLDIVSTYRRSEADSMRRRVAATPALELAKSFLDDYAREEPDIKAVASPGVKDDRARNVVVVTEAYEIPSFWKNHKRELRGWVVEDRLPKSVASSRLTPVEVPHPVHVRHEIIVRTDDRMHLGRYGQTIASRTFLFASALSSTSHEMRLQFDYRSLADSVAAGELKAHQQALARLEDELTFLVLPDFTSPDAPVEGWGLAWGLAAAGGGIAVAAGLAAWARRKRRAGREALDSHFRNSAG